MAGVRWNEVFYGHAASGKSASFVETDSIDTSESLDRIEVLNENLLTTQTDGSKG